MAPNARSATWDEASSPAASQLARRFEEAWRAARPRDRPDPLAFPTGGPDSAGPESSAAARLALLRADFNLRWEAGDPARVEDYARKEPNLDPDTLVALCYEEFCLREEFGEAPVPVEYEERFPRLTERLRRVFDIHELIGDAPSTALHLAEPLEFPFPDAGQTIAGFHLVEELGRGAFARVFLARERQLADRPVALKVARNGSREPQTLARLQHTHIVPVHSYRVDPATGLHLLCMPYFGRVTLARLLADPAAAKVPTGQGLLDILDRLDPLEGRVDGSSARTTLARLPYARAIAWWGARLAEALAHAHDRGVLHRDIKPSNVLVTSDGLPMLLDFNLAREPWIDGAAVPPEALGGTFAYMAPEHLEALAIGDDDRVDRRSDLFSLGVLLYEALTGSRPFPACPGGSSMAEALQRAAESRRGAPPRLRTDHPEIPGAFERVIRRCLDPDPTRRHPTALELASDLQAVADDAPLPSTREPLALRALRRARRSWKRLALVIPLATAVVLGALALVRAGNERLQLDEKAARLLLEGNQALDRGDSSAALVHFATLESLTEGRSDLEPLHRQAARQRIWTLRSRAMRSSAETFLRASATLRDQMLDGRASPEVIRDGLNRALRPFDVASDPAWSRRPDLGLLDPQSRERLVQDIDELLFVHAVHLDPRDPAQNQEARQILGRALGSTRLSEPWLALGGRLSGTQTLAAKQDPRKEGSARLCFAWGVLRDREGQTPSAIAWLERACVLAPGSAWYRRYLADVHERAGAPSEALRHLEAAVAADPGSKAALLARARVLRTLGETAQARDDEERARLAGVLESRPAK